MARKTKGKKGKKAKTAAKRYVYGLNSAGKLKYVGRAPKGTKALPKKR